jgi:cytochrome P450
MTVIAPDRLADPDCLLDPATHADADPHAVWTWMRRNAPVHRHAPAEFPGFWSVTRYEDVRAVYRDSSRFSSAHGVLLRPRSAGSDPGAGQTLALTDPPRHQHLRALIADWFSTRSVRVLEASIDETVRTLVERAGGLGACDFVHDVAARLSLYVICGIIGIPASRWEEMFRWTNEAFEAEDPAVRALAHQRVMEAFADLMYQRMEEPTDDLVSALANGSPGGELLTEQEIMLNCENLLGATENGRLALIGAMLAFFDHPDQWDRLRADPALMPHAIEEVLRWTSSATHSMRTAAEPAVLRGQRIERGDRVVLWLPSANRDEDVFADPFRFDIGRSPNRHLALGSGVHVCIGGTLARAQLRILLTALLSPALRIEQRGPAVRVASIAVNGAASLPVWIGGA